MQLPIVIDPQRWTIERVVDHVDHAVGVMGIEHLGLGGDFIRQVWRALPMRAAPDSLLPDGMPMDAAIEGLAGPEEYANLVEALRRRGYEGQRLKQYLAVTCCGCSGKRCQRRSAGSGARQSRLFGAH